MTQPVRANATGPLISFEHLYKSFGPKVVFRDLNLEVREGETLTVIGGSGSGKSVLLKCLIGLLRPDRGRIYFDGQELTALSEAALLPVRRRIAMVFQSAALFDSLTVGENVAYPIRVHYPNMEPGEMTRRVARALERVALPGTEQMRPSDLSGGMRKRVALARAIAIEPEVILWDEPTTGLDPISTHMIGELINQMKEQLGCTSVVVTHDMESAFQVSDRIAMLADARIVQVGTVEQMRQSTLPQVRAFFDARSTTLSRAGARQNAATERYEA